MVIVLCHSRHCFVWPMQQQKLAAVIAGLEAVWAFFGGMPRYLVIDNFPAAAAGTDPLHPHFTRGFLEYAQHRGFIPDPGWARHPRDKPKVERGVPYARERFFKGADFNGFAQMRAAAPKWCLEVAGMRTHGTTRQQPLVVFQDEERHTLLPWDSQPYEIANWRTARVHQDHHIQCLQALYSIPSDVCPPGQKVEVRLDSKLVRVYHREQLVKTHARQPVGGRATDPNDYPAAVSAYTTRATDQIKHDAARLGPAVAEFADRLFDNKVPWARIRQGHKLLRLGERYTAQRLDAACQRALAVDLMTCAAWNASWCSPWRRRAHPNCHCPCRQVVLPVPETSSPTPPHTAASRPEEITHTDFNGDGAATWQEFGDQRPAPVSLPAPTTVPAAPAGLVSTLAWTG